MSGTAEQRYRRLLRWYPRAWRQADHDVLLHALLDDASAAGRTRPTAGEAVSVAVHGTAARFDRRTTAAAAGAATVLAVLAAVAYFTALSTGWGFGGAVVWVSLAVVPLLLVIATAALLRSGGLIGDRLTVLLPPAALLAGAAGGAAVVLWSIGFDAADAGRPPPPGNGEATLVCVLTAWAVTTGVVAAVLTAVLRPTGLPFPARTGVGLLVGVPAAPVLGLSFLQLGGPVACAAGVLAAVLLTGPRSARPTAAAGPPPSRSARPADRAAVVLTGVGTAAALAAVAFSFAGGPLGVFGLDGTGAMRVGLGCGALAGVLVVLGVARGGVSRRPLPRSVLLLLLTGLGLNAVGGLSGPFPDNDVSFAVVVVSGALFAAALAVLVHPVLPGTPWARIVLAVLAGLVFLAAGGLLIGAAAGFVGAVVVARQLRRRRVAAATAA